MSEPRCLASTHGTTCGFDDSKAGNNKHREMMIMSPTITTDLHRPGTSASTLRAGLHVVVLKRLQRMLFAWLAERALRRTEAQLQRLDDKTLRDIGLSRGEIGSVLRDRSGDRTHDTTQSIARYR